MTSVRYEEFSGKVSFSLNCPWGWHCCVAAAEPAILKVQMFRRCSQKCRPGSGLYDLRLYNCRFVWSTSVTNCRINHLTGVVCVEVGIGFRIGSAHRRSAAAVSVGLNVNVTLVAVCIMQTSRVVVHCHNSVLEFSHSTFTCIDCRQSEIEKVTVNVNNQWNMNAQIQTITMCILSNSLVIRRQCCSLICDWNVQTSLHYSRRFNGTVLRQTSFASIQHAENPAVMLSRNWPMFHVCSGKQTDGLVTQNIRRQALAVHALCLAYEGGDRLHVWRVKTGYSYSNVTGTWNSARRSNSTLYLDTV